MKKEKDRKNIGGLEMGGCECMYVCMYVLYIQYNTVYVFL